MSWNSLGAFDGRSAARPNRRLARIKRWLLGILTRSSQAPSSSGLTDSEEQLRAIIYSASDAIITIDDQHRITLFNKAAEQIFRCAASEVLGQPLDRFIPERFRARHRSYIEEFGRTRLTTRAMGGERVLAALRA